MSTKHCPFPIISPRCQTKILWHLHFSQVTDPKDERPLADIWDVNHWIALRRQERFADLFGCGNTSGLKPSETQDSKPATDPGNSVLGGKKLGVDVGFI